MPGYEVVLPKDDAEAAREIVDADGAFGWILPELLPSGEEVEVVAESGRRAVLWVLLRRVGESSLCDLESKGHLLRSHQSSHHDVRAGVVSWFALVCGCTASGVNGRRTLGSRSM